MAMLINCNLLRHFFFAIRHVSLSGKISLLVMAERDGRCELRSCLLIGVVGLDRLIYWQEPITIVGLHF